MATQDDRESEADRHVAMVCGATRHAGWGLHNRSALVRFLSQLPRIPLNSPGLRLHGAQLFFMLLTPLDPNGGNTSTGATDVPLVIDYPAHEATPAVLAQAVAP
jgi:hypothetical protein